MSTLPNNPTVVYAPRHSKSDNERADAGTAGTFSAPWAIAAARNIASTDPVTRSRRLLRSTRGPDWWGSPVAYVLSSLTSCRSAGRSFEQAWPAALAEVRLPKRGRKREARVRQLETLRSARETWKRVYDAAEADTLEETGALLIDGFLALLGGPGASAETPDKAF
jgi:hypothetical protein